MIGYDIEVIGLDEQLQKLIQFDLITNRHMAKAMQDSVFAIQSEVVPLAPVGVSSRLKNSIGSSVQDLGDSLIGKVGTSLKDEIYPQTMEYGREPGTMPPPASLLRWVHLKIRPPEWKEYSVAFNIARKIKWHGIKGRFFMKTGFEKARTRIVTFFNAALERITEDLSNGR